MILCIYVNFYRLLRLFFIAFDVTMSCQINDIAHISIVDVVRSKLCLLEQGTPGKKSLSNHHDLFVTVLLLFMLLIL